MMNKRSDFISVICVLGFTVCFPLIIFGQTISTRDLKGIDQTADEFIQEFQSTLDFGKAFEKFSAGKSILILKKAGFFKGLNIAPALVDKLDNRTLSRVYVTEMNLYSLVTIYDLARYGEGRDSYNDGDLSDKPQVAALQESNKLNPLVSGSGAPIISRAELERNLDELNKVLVLYRKALSPDIFSSTSYTDRLERFVNFRKIKPMVSSLKSGFGFPKTTKIYTFQKGIFNFQFIKRNEQFKIFIILIDD